MTRRNENQPMNELYDARLDHDDVVPNGVSANQKAKLGLKRTFPWVDFLFLWGTCFLAAWLVPRLARLVPVSPRTDLSWWQTGVFYQTDVVLAGDLNASSPGRFQDITRRLDYLHSLGVAAVRLPHVYQSDRNGAAINFHQVAPQYGVMEDFEEMIELAHQKGLKVVMSMHLAGTSRGHPWVTECLADRGNCDMYVSDVKQSNDTWQDQDGAGSMTSYHRPDLNQSSPETQRKLQEVLLFWLAKGLDGIVLTDMNRLHVEQPTTHKDVDSEGFVAGEVRSEDGERPLVTACDVASSPRQPDNQAVLDVIARWRTHVKGVGSATDRKILFAVQLNEFDQHLRSDLELAGFDLVLHASPLDMDATDRGRSVTFRIRDRFSETLAGTPVEQWLGWSQQCHQGSPGGDTGHDAPLHLLSLILTGTPFICPGVETAAAAADTQSTTTDQTAAVRRSTGGFRALMSLREQPAFMWGEQEAAVTTGDVLSLVRFAFGRLHPRYLMAFNFGGTSATGNFSSFNTGSIKISNEGRIVLVVCPQGGPSLVPSGFHDHNSQALPLDRVTLAPMCLTIIEFISMSL